MEYDQFLDYINDLGLNYFKKGDTLILSPSKIEAEKNNIRLSLIDESKSLDYISLGNFEITSNLIKDLIKLSNVNYFLSL